MKVRIGHDGGYCPACGQRLGDAFGPTKAGGYGLALSHAWYRDDRRHWRRKAKGRNRPHPKLELGVQSIDHIVCPCGAQLDPP